MAKPGQNGATPSATNSKKGQSGKADVKSGASTAKGLKSAQEQCAEKSEKNSSRAKRKPPPPLESAGLAYENLRFLNSPDGRPLRVLSEYLEPLARFRRERIQDTVVFFGSARFRALDDACHEMELLANTTAVEAAPEAEQPAKAEDLAKPETSELRRKRAEAAVEMAHYYEDARRLAFMLTEWSMGLRSRRRRFVVTSGGGPGIMEAANRGAFEAGGKTIGLNIKLPFEQAPNRYITPSLNLEFHYFFMRKYWFAYLAKGMVVFPGGFGTLDEMFELMTLVQTHKLAKKITIVLYGRKYWEQVINMQTLVDKGAIAPGDLDLFEWAETPEEAFAILKAGLSEYLVKEAREFDEQSGEAAREPEAAPEVSPEEFYGPEISRTRQ
jgi:uncharacterized protein (TIGR00730 family)